MKMYAKVVVALSVVGLIAGCASSSVYVPRLPAEVDAKLLDYFEQPGDKVFIVAIDPSGDYAYAYDYGKPSLKAAAKVAVKKCDAGREANGVLARPYIYALNDTIVYEEMIRKAQAAREKGLDADKQVQVDAAGVQDAENEEVSGESASSEEM